MFILLLAPPCCRNVISGKNIKGLFGFSKEKKSFMKKIENIIIVKLVFHNRQKTKKILQSMERLAFEKFRNKLSIKPLFSAYPTHPNMFAFGLQHCLRYLIIRLPL